MAKWIAFDDDTISTLAQQTRDEIEVGVGDPLAVAVVADTPVLLMLPGVEGQITMLKVSRSRRPEPQRYVATGFLGLNDMEVGDEEFEEEDVEKPWWRRLLRR